MTSLWDDDSVVASASTGGGVTPMNADVASAGVGNNETLAENATNQIASITGADLSPEVQHLIAGLSPQEQDMLIKSINAASSSIAQASKGEGYVPTGNPALDKVLAKMDEEAKEKLAFQQNAMGVLGVGAAADVITGASILDPSVAAGANSLANSSNVTEVSSPNASSVENINTSNRNV
jgi:hypothetical protein